MVVNDTSVTYQHKVFFMSRLKISCLTLNALRSHKPYIKICLDVLYYFCKLSLIISNALNDLLSVYSLQRIRIWCLTLKTYVKMKLALMHHFFLMILDDIASDMTLR